VAGRLWQPAGEHEAPRRVLPRRTASREFFRLPRRLATLQVSTCVAVARWGSVGGPRHGRSFELWDSGTGRCLPACRYSRAGPMRIRQPPPPRCGLAQARRRCSYPNNTVLKTWSLLPVIPWLTRFPWIENQRAVLEIWKNTQCYHSVDVIMLLNKIIPKCVHINCPKIWIEYANINVTKTLRLIKIYYK